MTPAMREIIEATAAKYNTTLVALQSPSRLRLHAYPRHEAMFELFAQGRWSMPQIARSLNRKDHTSVLHAIRAHAGRNGLLLENTKHNPRIAKPYRAKPARTHCGNGHELAPENLIDRGLGYAGRCRSCQRLGDQRYNATRRARRAVVRGVEEFVCLEVAA